MSTYSLPNTDLNTKATSLDKTDKNFCPSRAYVLAWVRERQAKQRRQLHSVFEGNKYSHINDGRKIKNVLYRLVI